MERSPSRAFVYRLRGKVRHKERTFDLRQGEYSVGSSRSSHVALPDHGVSRQHAVLIVSPGGLVVEDRGSTNGTFIDGRRVERSSVPPGTELCFGPVRLRVESVDADDAELAIALPVVARSLDPATQDSATRTTRLGGAVSAEPGDVPAAYPELAFPPAYHVGTSPAISTLYRQMRQLVRGDLPVLVVGETGVGKEQVARILHASSGRQADRFVAVNCAAIPSELLEAEMFGIGQGVATGVQKRVGKFQLADGGTLFLDEVAEMAPALQAKLLRALQEKEIQPLGELPRTLNVRVVAATNADLFNRMEEGTFRRDLFYRLAGYLLEVPPLRECREDVPALVQRFLLTFTGESGIGIRGLSAKALRRLCEYDWPGNVRELEHEVRRLVYLGHDGQVLDSSLLSERIRTPQTTGPAPRDEDPEEERSLALKPRLRALQIRLIREALRRTHGNQVKAARLLDVSRNGLAKMMKRLGPGNFG